MSDQHTDPIIKQMDQFYNTYKSDVEHKIRNFGIRNVMHIEDMVSEVFLRALTSLKSRPAAEPIHSPRKWLLKIAENVCYGQKQMATHESSMLSLSLPALLDEEATLGDTLVDDQPSTESMAEIQERIGEVRSHLSELPVEQKHAAWLLYGEELTSEEISQQTGKPASTIRRDANRGKKQLRVRLLHMQD